MIFMTFSLRLDLNPLPVCRPSRFAILMVLLAITGAAIAQQAPAADAPRTGDEWVDARLQEINIYAQRYPAAFADELVRYQRTPRSLVQELVDKRSLAPGDVYFSCAIAQAIGRPCSQIASAWIAGQTEGWGAVAQRFGIEPESDVFVRVKRGFVATFDRWNRPITLDHALERHFADRDSRPYRWIPPKPDE